MNKVYYKIDSKVDTKETGNVYPAIESSKDYDFNAENSVYNLRTDTFPNFTPNFDFVLSKGAKEVDILSQARISANGLVISQRLKEYFLNCVSVPQMSFELKIQNVNTNYHWMQFMWVDSKKFVDFEKSVFKISEFGNSTETDKEIKSINELENYQNQLGIFKILYPSSLYLVDNVFEIITLPFIGGIGVSDFLRNNLINKGFTGIEFKEIN